MKINPETVGQAQGRALSSSEPTYQLDTRGVDIPFMVSSAEAELYRLRRKAVGVAVDSGAWHSEYPSLRDFRFLRKQYKKYSSVKGEPIEMFDRMTGAVNVPVDQLVASPLGGFFTQLRTRIEGDFAQLRGLTYYVSEDPNKNTPEKKLEIMIADVSEGLDLLNSVDRKSLDAASYPLYVGILDHVKAHPLTAFHALTFHERIGVIPDDVSYMRAREEAAWLMFTTTRAYFQTILGQPFNEGFEPVKIKDALARTADYIADNGHSLKHFTYRELTNPVIVMLGVHEAASKKIPFPDLIIGIPSGGTEIAIATHLMYENLYPDGAVPDIAFVPLSFHYGGQKGMDSDKLAGILKQSTTITGKRVLIVDDNSNTGLTLQTMAEAAVMAGASNIAIHIAELDTARVEAKFRKRKGSSFHVVKMDHPDLQTTMGICWTSKEDGSDLRRVEVGRFVREAYRNI